MILLEHLNKVIERFYASVDCKEIDFNQTASRVLFQPLTHSTAAVSSGHVYIIFDNCNVVIKMDMPDGLTLMRGHLRQYSVSNSLMKIKFFANKNTTEIEQTE